MFNIYSHKSLVRSSVRQLLSQECKEEGVYESYFQTVASDSSHRWYLLLLSSQMGTATFNSLNTHILFLLTTQHFLQSTISPQTVLRSQHCGKCKSLTVTCNFPSLHKKCLVLTYSPYHSVYSDWKFSEENTQVKGAKS